MSDSALTTTTQTDWKQRELQRSSQAAIGLAYWQKVEKDGGYTSLWDVPGYAQWQSEESRKNNQALLPENRGFPRYEDDPIAYMQTYCKDTYRKFGTPVSNPECIPYWTVSQGGQVASVTHTNPTNPDPKTVVTFIDEPAPKGENDTSSERGGGSILKWVGGLGLLALLGYGSYQAYQNWDKIKAMVKG